MCLRASIIMLDASTTAFHLLSHLTQFKNILVITNGAKTALESASLGIKTICTGGEMTLESFSYVGPDAESTLQKYNADVAFFPVVAYRTKALLLTIQSLKIL